MWVNLLLKAVLFMLLVPGTHFNIPPGGKLIEKAVLHGIVFAIANYLVYMYVRPLLEGFDNPDTRKDSPCPPGSVKCASGDCCLKGDVHSPCS
jgi:hypothetical protein